MVVQEKGRKEIQHEVRGMLQTEVGAENIYCEPATGFCDTTRKPRTIKGPNLGTAQSKLCDNMAFGNLQVLERAVGRQQEDSRFREVMPRTHKKQQCKLTDFSVLLKVCHVPLDPIPKSHLSFSFQTYQIPKFTLGSILLISSTTKASGTAQSKAVLQ